MALSMLAKGPVAPFLAAVVIVIFAAAQRSMQIAWKTFWPSGIALFCAMGFPWYVLAQLRNPQFFRVFILEHNLARFGTNLYHHPEPFWYYIPVTLLGWVPWSVFVTAALAVAIWRFRNRDVDTLSTFLVIWLAVIVVFFSISRSKLPGYILPVMAPGILLVAEYVRGRFAQKPMLAIAGLHAALSASLIFSALMVQYILLQHRVPRNCASSPIGIQSFENSHPGSGGNGSGPRVAFWGANPRRNPVRAPGGERIIAVRSTSFAAGGLSCTARNGTWTRVLSQPDIVAL